MSKTDSSLYGVVFTTTRQNKFWSALSPLYTVHVGQELEAFVTWWIFVLFSPLSSTLVSTDLQRLDVPTPERLVCLLREAICFKSWNVLVWDIKAVSNSNNQGLGKWDHLSTLTLSFEVFMADDGREFCQIVNSRTSPKMTRHLPLECKCQKYVRGWGSLQPQPCAWSTVTP